ncbi:MAG: YggS family pyridoxal phosphate-dependent enzyme [Deltaproteobacteria bacterium]|nr:YggS family pyridoxal phosphate-dependent enzyme [Deltaproteobacteria bacterium]
MDDIAHNIERIQQRIDRAAQRANRDPKDVRLVAVSKTVDVDRIRQAISAGITILGENYVQEAKKKIELVGMDVHWHMVGHLQSNKARHAVKLFHMIHSLDSISLAQELNRRAKAAGRTVKVLVQVNLSDEYTKSGVSPDDVEKFLIPLIPLAHVRVRGLMCMPTFFNEPERVRPFFKALRELRDRLNKIKLPGIELKELSMGMSGDFEVAIEEGATLVRVGTAIFGSRS